MHLHLYYFTLELCKNLPLTELSDVDNMSNQGINNILFLITTSNTTSTTTTAITIITISIKKTPLPNLSKLLAKMRM